MIEHVVVVDWSQRSCPRDQSRAPRGREVVGRGHGLASRCLSVMAVVGLSALAGVALVLSQLGDAGGVVGRVRQRVMFRRCPSTSMISLDDILPIHLWVVAGLSDGSVRGACVCVSGAGLRCQQ